MESQRHEQCVSVFLQFLSLSNQIAEERSDLPWGVLGDILGGSSHLEDISLRSHILT